MSMSWSSRRRAFFLLSFILIIILIVAGLVIRALYHPPTCTDGVQNGTESGIDCGGTCTAVCPFEAIKPIVEWSRVFAIDQGVYSAVAFVENPNALFQAFDVPYVFRLRDENNILVYEQKGVADIPAKQKFPIFETGIQTGSRIPKRVEFAFLADPLWQRGSTNDIPLVVEDRILENASTSPRLAVRVTNPTLTPLPALNVVALLYAENGNVVNVSRTIMDPTPAGQERTLFFTWPQAFVEPVVRIDVIPLLRR